MNLQKIKEALEKELLSFIKAHDWSSTENIAATYTGYHIISEALAEFEKPADSDGVTIENDTVVLINKIRKPSEDGSIYPYAIGFFEANTIVRQYAEAYHQRKCAECKEIAQQLLKYIPHQERGQRTCIQNNLRDWAEKILNK